MITLRIYKKGDEFSLADNANSLRVVEHMRTFFPSPYKLSDAIWWVEEGHKIEGSYNLVIDLEGKCIGNIGFLNGDNKGIVELGCWIGEKHWNKGIMKKAIDSFVEHILSHNSANHIIALVASPNIGSMKAFEKCGFKCNVINKGRLDVRAGIFYEHVYSRSLE